MKQLYTDPYYYPGTNVLKNLADVRDRVALEILEGALTASQAVVVEAKQKPPYDLAHLLWINKILFGKLYPFGGKFREHTGRMTKTRPTGTTAMYCDSIFIPTQIADVFTKLASENYLAGLAHEAFAVRAAYFYGELDAVHPFREGNSRTLRLFFFGLGRSAGYKLDWSIIAATEDGRNKLYAARDRAVMSGDSAPLAALFASILSPL